MEKEILLKFIAKAHRNTYAAPKEVQQKYKCEVSILKGHYDYDFSEGDLSYHDSYAGRSQAPGREVVFLKGKPIWAMAYQGQYNSKYADDFFQTRAFPFLKKALMNFDDDMPFRGPKEFIEGDFRYTFEMEGDYDYFKGQERIFYKGESVFFQDVMGSLIK
ncbi:MAG: DUF5680 domain-containing protein [Nanoarchaeota archaeon]|nr:DUF5680 domain-containing protein [Nanoarchaeota archaeon]